ncbi:AAA family ATPase [Sinorhizobium fredii]|uniref:AAA family ATPase n=1 Tax=Rhizobium fredii TaxID=380 RepID=UPI0035176814
MKTVEDIDREAKRIEPGFGVGPSGEPNRDHHPNGRRKRLRPFKGLIDSATFLNRMRPPDYILDGLVMAGSSYTLTGNTGHCKTLIALLIAIRVARGEWFCGRKCRKGTVAFFAGENFENVRVQYYSMCAELGIEPPENLVWHEGVCSINEANAAVRKALVAYPDLVLVIFDSLQAFFEGDDDSQNMQMLDLAVGIRELTTGHLNRPASLVLAHPVKKASRDNLLPRGGSSILNEFDGNFTAWRDEDIVELHWQGKFRGAPFDPVKMEAVVIKPEGLVDARGDQMSCTVVRSLGPQREAEMTATGSDRLIRVLAVIRDNHGVTQSAIATAVGIARSTVQKDIGRLQKRKWLRDYDGKYVLTKEGEIALELARR